MAQLPAAIGEIKPEASDSSLRRYPGWRTAETLHILVLAIVGIVAQINQTAGASDAAYKPLWLYQGSWRITRSGQPSDAKPDDLLNQCALVGRYFACQQTVNGKAGGLLIIIPTEQSGHYHTQTIMPEGRAAGKGDLEITGDHWIFSSRWQDEPGKIVYYRTTNVFTGKNRIHFEQAESSDGKQWVVKGSGDDVRAGTY